MTRPVCQKCFVREAVYKGVTFARDNGARVVRPDTTRFVCGQCPRPAKEGGRRIRWAQLNYAFMESFTPATIDNARKTEGTE